MDKISAPSDVWICESVDHGPDPVTGCRVIQITNRAAMATNIYGEDPYCSAVSHRAVFIRATAARTPGPVEVWAHDLKTGLSRLIDADVCHTNIASHAYSDGFFYFRHSTGCRELVRLDLSTLNTAVVHMLAEDHAPFTRWGAVSPDHRYYANVIQGQNAVFHVLVIDLRTGQETCVASGNDLCNAHVSFDRMDGRYLFVQQNRGQRLRPEGLIETVDPTPGATLFVVSRDGRERMELPIAAPLFPGSISGHEAWIRGQPEILYSASGTSNLDAQGRRRGNLFVCRLGASAPRLVAEDPVYHGHVSTSECGRFWINDRFDPQSLFIAIGSLRTGRWQNLCQVGGRMADHEIGHAHPYMTPDRLHVLFVSTRTGTPQVFAVTVPDGLLSTLDSEA